jgi:hypothetical protein
MRTTQPTSIAGEPARIEPDAWYSDCDLRVVLRMSEGTLRRARRDGSLRFSRRGITTFHRGQWVIDWLSGQSEVAHAG